MTTGSYCGPCYSDHRQVSTVNWCMECDEAICIDCTKNHSLYKPLRSHHLVDIKLKTSQSIVGDISDMKCDIHEGREIEYFCTDHDQICCRDCLAKKHKGCENTISLESASENIKHSGVITDYNDRLDAMMETVSTLADNRKINSTEFIKESSKIKNEVRQSKQRLIARLNEMETDVLQKLEKITEDRTSNFEKEIDNANKMKEKVESYKQKIDFCFDHVSNKNTFVFFRKLENRLKGTETDLEKILYSSKHVSIGFKESDEIGSLVKTLGTVDVKEDRCTVKYRPPKQRHAQIPTLATKSIQSFELKHVIDMPHKIVTGIAITDNKVLLCDRMVKEILVYNDRNVFIKSIKLPRCPWDIAVVQRRNEAVVTFNGEMYIQIINTNSLTCGREVDIGVKVAGGVATTTDKIVVGGVGMIHVLNIEGKKLKTISVSGATSSVYYISVGINYTNYFYSSNYKKYFCVNESGNQMFSHTIPNESTHRNVETDLEGNVYIVGGDTNTIQRLHPDGSFDRVILDKNNGINGPLVISFNRNCNKLYVSNLDDSKLFVFDCK